jgi:hypothetical protein
VVFEIAHKTAQICGLARANFKDIDRLLGRRNTPNAREFIGLAPPPYRAI